MLDYTTLWVIKNYNTYNEIDAIFSDIHISQGSQSSAETRLRRGGILKHKFVANLLPSPSVKKFENRLIFGEV